MPAIKCTPWCVEGDGHTDEVFREDQTCWGPDAYVELSLEPVERDKYGFIRRGSVRRAYGVATRCE